MEYDEAYLKRDIEKDIVDDQEMKDEFLKLKPKPNIAKRITKYRILSMLCFLLCALVLVTEATVIYDFHYTLPYFVI